VGKIVGGALGIAGAATNMGLGIAKGVTGGVLGKSPVGKIVAGSLNGAQFAANAGLGIAGGVTRGVLGSEEDYMSIYGDHVDDADRFDEDGFPMVGSMSPYEEEELRHRRRFSMKKLGRGIKKAANSPVGKAVRKMAINYAK
jgi:hypothetical protein